MNMNKWLGLGVILLLCFAVYRYVSPPSAASTDWTREQVQALAASVKADEVEMYTTSECPYCAEAKTWLKQNGFAFTECNMSITPRCIDEFKDYGANGTPFLIIRRNGKTHEMKDGFDSQEFLTAL